MIDILGLVVIFVATYFAYKTAKDYERNAFMWGLIVFGVGFGIQIIIPFLIGVVIGIVMTVNGSSMIEIQESINSYSIILGFGFLGLSIIAMILVLKYLSSIPDDYADTTPESPPSPPEFDGN